MTLPFDEQDIPAAFDAATFQRGAHYAAAGAVRGLDLDAGGKQLWAQVRGTQRRALPGPGRGLPTAVVAGS